MKTDQKNSQHEENIFKDKGGPSGGKSESESSLAPDLKLKFSEDDPEDQKEF